jgi:HSP20 family protein
MMNGLTRWTPFEELRQLVTAMDQQLSGWSRPDSAGGGTEITNTSDGWQMRIPLPGMSPDDVEVTVAGRMLQLRAQAVEGDKRVTRYEQLMTLPEEVDADKISAHFRHGMLDLTLPAKEDLKPRRIEISTTDSKQLSQDAA